MQLDTASWTPRAGEGTRAYAAFCLYRDAGSSRSLVAVGQECSKSIGLIYRWSAAHDWVARAMAYDAHLEHLNRKRCEEEHTAQLAAFRERSRTAAERMGGIALALLTKAGKRLETMEASEIEPALIPAYLRAAAAVMEASLNAEAEAIGVNRLLCLLDE